MKIAQSMKTAVVCVCFHILVRNMDIMEIMKKNLAILVPIIAS